MSLCCVTHVARSRHPRRYVTRRDARAVWGLDAWTTSCRVTHVARSCHTRRYVTRRDARAAWGLDAWITSTRVFWGTDRSGKVQHSACVCARVRVRVAPSRGRAKLILFSASQGGPRVGRSVGWVRPGIFGRKRVGRSGNLVDRPGFCGFWGRSVGFCDPNSPKRGNLSRRAARGSGRSVGPARAKTALSRPRRSVGRRR